MTFGNLIFGISDSGVFCAESVRDSPIPSKTLVLLAVRHGFEPVGLVVSLLPGMFILLSFITRYYTTIPLLNQHIFGIYG